MRKVVPAPPRRAALKTISCHTSDLAAATPTGGRGRDRAGVTLLTLRADSEAIKWWLTFKNDRSPTIYLALKIHAKESGTFGRERDWE